MFMSTSKRGILWSTRQESKAFSKIPTDQANEQNNASEKGDGGTVGLTENDAALRRWTVGGPKMDRLVQEFESATKQMPIQD